MEEQTINDMIHKYETTNKIIVVYGKNSNDETAEKKYKQLVSLGLTDVYIYGGGLFEWLLLQDVYGKETFQTTQPSRDILYYRPTSLFK